MNIGIDIGGTTIGLILLNSKRESLYYKLIKTPISRDIDEVETCLIEEIDNLLNNLNMVKGSIESIGIGLPGIVSTDGRKIINCPNLKWSNCIFGERIFKTLAIRPKLFNDACSASFGEYVLGALKNSRRGVMLTLGTGLGGGIIFDGNLYGGASGIASEFGHMLVGENYYNCNCGNNGCLETFVSATSMVIHTNRLLEQRSSQSRVASAREVFERYRLGDSLAIEAVARFLKYMAIGIQNIMVTIDPDTIVIGGGMSLSGNLYLDTLKSLVSKDRAFKEVDIPNILISSMDERAGAIGSALLANHTPTL